jgi:hypothetical protein
MGDFSLGVLGICSKDLNCSHCDPDLYRLRSSEPLIKMTFRPAGADSFIVGQSMNISLLRSDQIELISYRLASPVRDETFVAWAKTELTSSVRSVISPVPFVNNHPMWNEFVQRPSVGRSNPDVDFLSICGIASSHRSSR